MRTQFMCSLADGSRAIGLRFDLEFVPAVGMEFTGLPGHFPSFKVWATQFDVHQRALWILFEPIGPEDMEKLLNAERLSNVLSWVEVSLTD